MRIEVDPGQLSGTSGRQAAVAGDLRETVGSLQAAVANAAGAAGDAGVAGAANAFGASLAQRLGALADTVGGLAANLGSAADAYSTTDATAMPGAGGGR